MEKEEPVNFGRSLIVPSVQQLAKQCIAKIPNRYVHQPVNHDPVIISSDDDTSVPIIDLHKLFAKNHSDSSSELNNLHSASKDWGFFQVINHGISQSLLDEFKREVLKFFELPVEDKLKLWQEEDNHEGFGQLFVVSEEQKLDWSDMFYITTFPHNLRKSQLFQKLSLILREKLEVYTVEMKKLAMAILGQMAKALGMDRDEIYNLFHDGVQSVRMNYYPPCPQPEMALGFSPHSDADALTIVYQLNETEGLQIQKDGKWVTIKPLANALVVNVGDIMEIVSNGVYKSIKHRAIVNSNNERLSVATFYSSNMGTELGPAASLIARHNVANFRRVPLEEYFKGFFARKLEGYPEYPSSPTRKSQFRRRGRGEHRTLSRRPFKYSPRPDGDAIGFSHEFCDLGHPICLRVIKLELHAFLSTRRTIELLHTYSDSYHSTLRSGDSSNETVDF